MQAAHRVGGSEIETAPVDGGGNAPNLPSRKIHVLNKLGYLHLNISHYIIPAR